MVEGRDGVLGPEEKTSGRASEAVRRRLGLPVLTLLAFATTFALVQSLLASSLRAQSGPSIVSTTQQINFPSEINFSALVENGDRLSEAILFYRVLPEGAITRQVAEITTGDVTRLLASVPTAGFNSFIPSGSTIEWSWRLTDTDGASVETDEAIFQYDDPRYTWIPIEDESLVLFYYGDNRGTAERLHRQGSEVIDQMSQLLDVELDFQARVYMWASPEDASGVERIESQTFEQQVITGGTRVLADLVHMFQPTTWVVRHELTHILTALAGEGGIGNIPGWLDEGTATYSEIDWRARRGAALNFAIETDQLFTVRGLTSASNEPGRVDIFYGQSGDIVTYLISTFGEEPFAELFAVFKLGSTVDNALTEVYGLDRDTLNNAYRESLGLEPLAILEDRSTVIEDEPISPSGTPQDSGESTDVPAEEQPSDESPGDTTVPATETPTIDRSDEAVAARRAEIEDRLENRRPAPVFSTGGDFPWEGVVTGVGGAALLMGLVLFWLLLRESERRAAWQPAESPLTGRFAPPVELPPSSGDALDGAPDVSPTQPPASSTSYPPPPAHEDDVGGWGGWRTRDD